MFRVYDLGEIVVRIVVIAVCMPRCINYLRQIIPAIVLELERVAERIGAPRHVAAPSYSSVVKRPLASVTHVKLPCVYVKCVLWPSGSVISVVSPLSLLK